MLHATKWPFSIHAWKEQRNIDLPCRRGEWRVETEWIETREHRRQEGSSSPAEERHYKRQLLPRVSNALEEGAKTLGEAFPECNTRGRASGDAPHGEEAFPECHPSTRGSFDAVGAVHPFFLKPLPRVQHSWKNFLKKNSSPSVALGEEFCFFKKSSSPSAYPRHSGKNISCCF
jgi:hypothetical protein